MDKAIDALMRSIRKTGGEHPEYRAKAALAALEAEGYLVVPKVPTPEMWEAFSDMQANRDDGLGGQINAGDAWKAMIAAATKDQADG